MAVVTVRVPNPDIDDVLDALEKAWSKEVSRINPNYDQLTPGERAGLCLSAYLRSITKAHRHQKEVNRRKALDTPIVVEEPDVT